MSFMIKLKVAFVSLTSCEGCYFSLLNLGNEFLEVVDKIDLVKFRLIEEREEDKNANYDLAFIEGSPVTKENIDKLIDLRVRTKRLVVLGGCAHTGGTYAMRNHTDKEKALKHTYPKVFKTIFNPTILGLSKIIKIDAIIPTCPVNAREFVRFISHVLNGIDFKIVQRPVCYECQLAGAECLLKKGEPCFGPIALGGCSAPCPQAGMPCQICRGPMEEINWDNFERKIKEVVGSKKWERNYEEMLEIFNVKDLIKVKSEKEKVKYSK